MPGVEERRLSDGNGGLFLDAWLLILVKMAYPADAPRAFRALEELLLLGTEWAQRQEPEANESSAPELETPPAKVPAELANTFYSSLELVLRRDLGDDGRRRVRAELTRRIAEGRAPAYVFLLALRAGQHKRARSSLKRAIAATSWLTSRSGPQNRWQWQIPSSESKLWQYWKDYKPVVHLHAADLLFEQTGREWEYDANQVIAFLSLAEQLRKMGCRQEAPIGRTRSKSSGDFLLHESSAWQPPADLRLYAYPDDWELPALKDFEIAALEANAKS